MRAYAFITGGGRPSPGKTRVVSQNVYVPFRPAGTHAYVVSQRGAKRLLERCPKARYHVDLTAWSLPDLKLFAARDFLATQAFGDDTTVSKTGAPMTKGLLDWCWRYTGLLHMTQKAGIPSLTWAWKTALLALPVPFSSRRQRVILELGPMTSVGVILALLSVPLKSLKPFGIAFAYMSSIIFMMRWLAGTDRKRVCFSLTIISIAICFFL